jgi:hypothetical protein
MEGASDETDLYPIPRPKQAGLEQVAAAHHGGHGLDDKIRRAPEVSISQVTYIQGTRKRDLHNSVAGEVRSAPI